MTKYSITPELLAELQGAQRRTQPKRLHKAKPETFVKMPYAWTLEAAGLLGDAYLAVLVELAYQAFKTHQSQVLLANAALQSVGITRYAKLRALRQLEANGMVVVDWRGRGRSPLVTPLWLVRLN